MKLSVYKWFDENICYISVMTMAILMIILHTDIPTIPPITVIRMAGLPTTTATRTGRSRHMDILTAEAAPAPPTSKF